MIWDRGYSVTNARAAPFGGRDRVLDTNPYCVGIPAGEGRPPVIVDFATPRLRGEGDERAAPRRRAASRDDRRQRGQADHRPRRLLRRRGAGPVRRPQGVRDHDRRRADGPGVRPGPTATPAKGRDADDAPQGVTFLVLRADALGPMEEFISRVDATLDGISGSRLGRVRRGALPRSEGGGRRGGAGPRASPFAEDVWEMFTQAALKVGVEL